MEGTVSGVSNSEGRNFVVHVMLPYPWRITVKSSTIYALRLPPILSRRSLTHTGFSSFIPAYFKFECPPTQKISCELLCDLQIYGGIYFYDHRQTSRRRLHW